MKPGGCGHTQHHSTTLGSSSASDGSRTQASHGGTSKSTFSDHHSPAMTTDQETGMRKFVEHPSPTEQVPTVQDSTSKSKKLTKTSVSTSESISSTPTEGRSSTSSSSSSIATTPVQQRKEHERKGKGVRKSSTSRVQKASVVVNSSTAKQPQRGGAAVQPTLQQAPPPSPQVVKEHLERKASESSLRSIDSESTSSTSDKSEKEENATSPGEAPEIDSSPPLAKEPGTGQTIPLLLAQEECLLSKAKHSPPEPVTASSPPEECEGKSEEAEKDGVLHVQEREVEKKEKLPLLPTPRPRSKKKLRQQQRKEDKLRRKEREREKVREREEEEKRKEQNIESEMKQTTEPPELQLTVEETTDQSSVPEENRSSKVVAISPKKAKRLELKTHSKSATKLPSGSRTAPAHVAVPPTPPPPPSTSPSPPAQPPAQNEPEERSHSPEVEQLAETWPGTELDDFKESPESLSPSSQPELTFSRENSEDGDQSDAVLQSSHPMEAIPMSALRAMRAKGTKQRKVEEEEGAGAPTSLPKKNVTTARRTKEAEKTSTRSTDKSSTSAPPQVETKKKKFIPSISTDDTSTDSTPSPEPSKVVETDLLIKSPHEIAATLLIKNPAIKKRKVKTDPEQEGSDEGDDVKYEKRASEEEHSGKVLWAADGDRHPMGLMRHYNKAPSTLSLDAEPFYPSSDYVPRVKQYKKYHHADTPYAHASHLNVPSAFSSPSPGEESGVYFERKPRVREIRPPHHLSLRSSQLRHHGNTLTPSPPPYAMSTDTYYGERHSRIEPSESSRYSHISPDVSPYELQHDEYYTSSTTGRHLGVDGLPGPRSRMSRTSAFYDDQIYGSSQQHEAAVYAAAQRRERHALSHLSPTSSWDQHHLMQDEETALLRRQQQVMLARKLREEQLVKMHARRSAETLSTLNYPQPHLARSTLYSDATPSWEEDVYLSAHQADDAFLTEPVHPHPIRQPRQQLLQEHMSQMPSYPRRRRYSSDNEVGGEFLPDLLQTPSSPGPISSSTGLNKAPGTAFSGMAQARAAAVSGRPHDIMTDNSRSEVRPSS